MNNIRPVVFLAEIGDKSVKGDYFDIQILRTGKWKYRDDDLVIDNHLLSDLFENFNSKVYYPVPVDGPVRGGSAHSPSDLHDCGFVEALALRGGGSELWATIKLTNKDIAEMVDEGSLAYCSSEFMLGWMEPASEKSVNVLNGLGLTNRPFIKNMAPARKLQTVNFSEIIQDNSMNEKEIEALKAKVIELGEAVKVNSAVSVELAEAKKANEKLLSERRDIELASKAVAAASALDKFESTLKSAMEKNANVSPALANKAMQLAEAIVRGEPVNGSARFVNLVEGNDPNGSIYHDANATIRKCDLISLLTETINALPGDLVYVKPMGRSNGDEMHGEDFDLQREGDDSDNGAFKFSDRFKEVQPRAHGITTEVILSEAAVLVSKDPTGKLDIVTATQQALHNRGIKNLQDVK